MFPRQAQRWADENVGELWIDRDPDGRPVALKADPIVAINVVWFKGHGWQDIFTDDGGLEIGELRYRWLRDLPDGSTAYERVGD
jgi:hypothetical protein